jgi:hypothetical protein
MENRSLKDVGGTPGGIGYFVMGFIMTCIGGYLISNQVNVVGSYWSFYGANTFGITLIPLLFGIGILFWNGKSTIGWILTAAGALFILAGCDRQYAHLLPARDFVRNDCDAGLARGWPRINRAVSRRARRQV